MLKDKKIMVLCGGGDVEGEVSIKTADGVCKSLTNLEYKFTKCIFSQEIFKDELQRVKPDIVFNAMHGRWGEDGIIPKILDYEQILYTHSNYKSSSIGINKLITLQIANSIGIPTVENSFLVTKEQLLKGLVLNKKLLDSENKKIILKPNSQGSSVGCYFFEKQSVKSNNGILKLSDDQQAFVTQNTEDFYILEDCFDGFEFTCGIFNDKIVGEIRITPKQEGFYNYKAKYTYGETTYDTRPKIDEKILAQIKQNAIDIHKTIKANFISRSDFLISHDQKNYVFLEINTHPGLTQTSLIPKMIEQNKEDLKIFDDYDNNFNDKLKLSKLSSYDKMVDMILLNSIRGKI
jgi:D-alanine-D-alanine ligase